MEEVLLSNLIVPSVISKEECLYCFESVYNESADSSGPLHSLNLSLTTFQSVCNNHLAFYSQVIGQNSNVRYLEYLNIYRIKKLETDDNQDSERNINKKIKLHVTEKSQDDIYDTFWSLVRYDTANSVLEKLLSSVDSNIAPATEQKINQILHSKSQEMMDEAKTWELSINSCVHTRNFSVPAAPAKELIERCADCDLDQNLWLCLHCGNVGCGREQIGIDGHSHAKKHYENNAEHSLAVKLGSLSSTSCDVYCYACDDEVKFEDREVFVQTLLKYGIDLNKKYAKEKTLVELQVEQNMNWDFQMTDSKGHDLTRLQSSKEYGCGLINLGNSCYMNSVLQCLLNGGVRSYSWDELGHEFPKNVVHPETNLKCQLIKLNNAMKLDPDAYSNGIRPTSFKKCVGQSHEEFSSGRQQDALEFLTYLTDFLDVKLLKNLPSNPNDLLKFTMEDRLKCNNCGKVKYTSQLSEAIQLPLLENDEPQNLIDRLREYFSGENLEFKCPTTGKLSTAIKTPGFKTFPDTLVINPIRIKLQGWTPVKTSTELIIPGLDDPSKTLDVSEFKSRGFDPTKEELLSEMEDDTESFEPNTTSVAQLTEMGFGFNAIVRALYTTGNQETEAAMNWLFQHMEDGDLNDAFVPPSTSKNRAASLQVDADSLENMVAMGLNPKLCRKALILKKGNVNESVEWVFSNLDDNGEIPETYSSAPSDVENVHGHSDPAQYELTGVVCHKGNSVQSGHYVAFIRKTFANEKRWILYNDEKIVVASEESFEEIKKNGYFYFFSRV